MSCTRSLPQLERNRGSAQLEREKSANPALGWSLLDRILRTFLVRFFLLDNQVVLSYILANTHTHIYIHIDLIETSRVPVCRYHVSVSHIRNLNLLLGVLDLGMCSILSCTSIGSTVNNIQTMSGMLGGGSGLSTTRRMNTHTHRSELAPDASLA